MTNNIMLHQGKNLLILIYFIFAGKRRRQQGVQAKEQLLSLMSHNGI